MNIIRDIITSRNNTLVKWTTSLESKKGREKERTFIAEGEKLTIEALEAHLPVSHIFIDERRHDELFEKIAPFLFDEYFENTKVVTLSEGAFEKISTEMSPQGIICAIKYLDFFNNIDIIYKDEFFLEENERTIILSSVRDPGNLGSVIRSAVAFGVEHIIVTADSADIYNPKTVRSAMGSLFRVKITKVSSLDSCIKIMQELGRRVFAAELSDKALPISDIMLTSQDSVIIGNEGHGIDKTLSSICDGSVYIPISRKTESLNASVAAAIFMWEQNKML